MKYSMADTSPQIQKILVEGFRKMSPSQKLTRVQDLTQAVLQIKNIPDELAAQAKQRLTELTGKAFKQNTYSTDTKSLTAFGVV